MKKREQKIKLLKYEVKPFLAEIGEMYLYYGMSLSLWLELYEKIVEPQQLEDIVMDGIYSMPIKNKDIT